jgi:tRNA(adenine34) deaminase
MQFNHQYWMSQAVSFASEVKDEVPISALIVKNNILISKAVNQIEALNDATAHAEILAIREASRKLGDWRLNDCTLYTTLEPCAMCAGQSLFDCRL